MQSGKVLHVITGTAIGGAEIMLLRYLTALGPERARHSVVSMMPPGPVAERIRALGVPVSSLGLRGAAGLAGGIWRLARRLRRDRPALIHGWMYHGCLISTLALMLAGGRARRETALLWAIHHSLSDPAREKPMTRAVLAGLRRLSGRVDLITYCSALSRDQHRAFGFPATRDRLIVNAIDPQEFAPDPAARARLAALTGAPEGRLFIGNIARAHPMKDHACFARAIAALHRRGLDVQGVVIGAGQPGGAAEIAGAEAGISARLTALPARDDIAALVPGLDLYLLSSAWGEALPLAVAEAMAAGIPAVVTDIGDCGWLVAGTGATCPPGDPEALAEAAAPILSAPPEARAARAAACRARVMRDLSPAGYIRAHDEAYGAARAHRAHRLAPRPLPAT